jgi:hypothetical protein
VIKLPDMAYKKYSNMASETDEGKLEVMTSYDTDDTEGEMEKFCR